MRNGWVVTADGSVYAIIKGSICEGDATGTPLVKLPPGDYALRPAARS